MKKHKFKCKICGEEFRYVTNVMNHIAKTHKIDKNERESFLEREDRKGSKYIENKEILERVAKCNGKSRKN